MKIQRRFLNPYGYKPGKYDYDLKYTNGELTKTYKWSECLDDTKFWELDKVKVIDRLDLESEPEIDRRLYEGKIYEKVLHEKNPRSEKLIKGLKRGAELIVAKAGESCRLIDNFSFFCNEEFFPYSTIGHKFEEGSTSTWQFREAIGDYPFTTQDNLELLERGNVWRYYHNETLKPFASLEEEAVFYMGIGRAQFVMSEFVGLNHSLPEVFRNITLGKYHGYFTKSLGMTRAVMFLDADIGSRVREYTLSTFKPIINDKSDKPEKYQDSRKEQKAFEDILKQIANPEYYSEYNYIRDLQKRQ